VISRSFSGTVSGGSSDLLVVCIRNILILTPSEDCQSKPQAIILAGTRVRNWCSGQMGDEEKVVTK
jgi:hypothetical protein